VAHIVQSWRDAPVPSAAAAAGTEEDGGGGGGAGEDGLGEGAGEKKRESCQARKGGEGTRNKGKGTAEKGTAERRSLPSQSERVSPSIAIAKHSIA